MADDLRKLIAAQRALVRTIEQMPSSSVDWSHHPTNCPVCGGDRNFDYTTDEVVCRSCAKTELDRLEALCSVCGNPHPVDGSPCSTCAQVAAVDA